MNNNEQPNNPLHGLTLEYILNCVVEYYGWSELHKRLEIKCFEINPSIKSSLKFLRKNEWARTKVESIF
jgi:uncharacterized protein (DUF2132 family)